MNNKERISKILNIIKYPIEFIIMTVFALVAYKFITIKCYEGYWSKTFLIYLIITGILASISLIYNCIKDKDKIEKIFITFAIPIGIMYIVFMLPSYTPDASAHIWKAYEVSNGILFTEIDENGKSLTNVPEALSIYRENKLTKYNVYNELINSNEAYDYSKTVEVDSPSKTYCFIFYIGHALGLMISRIFSLNIYFGLFLARIIGFVFFLILGYYSIKKIPFGKILIATYLMIPMMMHQATAVTVDCIMNGITILFIAYTLNLCFKEDKILKKEKVIYLILVFLLGLVKITYIPLIGLGLIFVKRRKEISKKEKIILGVATVVLCVSSLFIITKLNTGYVNESAKVYLETAGVNSGEQLNGIIKSPLRYMYVMLNNLRCNGEFYLYNAIGQSMGWLSISVPTIYITLYILLLMASIFIEDNKVVFDIKEKIWILILTIIMYLLVTTGLYLQWTGVGSNVVAGVQGRYFLPFMILALMTLCRKNDFIKLKNKNIIIPLMALLINGLFILKIIKFFI